MNFLVDIYTYITSNESIINIMYTQTHASVPVEQRKLLGISDNLIRLSVGIEDGGDLIQDLEQALSKLSK